MEKAVLIRLPEDLAFWLAQEAEWNDRSISKEAKRIIEETKKQREEQRKVVNA